MNELMTRGSKGFVMKPCAPFSNAFALITGSDLCRHEDERQVPRALVRTESRRETEAVEHGHADVEEHDVGHMVEGQLQAFLTVRGLEHVVALALQDRRTEHPRRVVVVHDEHAGRAGTAARTGR